jgi:hypothetical protein
MIIDVKVVPHKEQRYETVGDWVFNADNSRLTIRVSDMGNWKYNMLVALHEQIEALLCLDRKINEKEITKFDIIYEAKRAQGYIDFQGEPGDHKDAPYRKEHFCATTIERQLAAELGVDWEEYDEAVMAL